MALSRFLLVALVVALAGCTQSAAPPAAEADDAPAREAARNLLVFETNLTFENETGVHEERFTLEGAHWICVDTSVPGEGRANLTMAVPEHPRPWQLASTEGNVTDAVMVPGMPGEYVVRLDLEDYTGRVWIRVEKQP